MQCHNCPHNGKNTGDCVNCNAADYLDNDHRTVIPVDDICKVEASVSPDAPSSSNSREDDFLHGKTERNYEDCMKVLNVLKTCDRSSLGVIATILGLFMSVGSSMPLMVSMVSGDTFQQYAEKHNITKQSANKTWNRVVRENPILATIKSKKARKCLYLPDE